MNFTPDRKKTMTIISYEFLLFVIFFILIYYIFPKRAQWWVILAGNVVFYAFSGFENLLIVLATSASSYFFSERMQQNLRKQDELTAGLDRKEARVIKEQMKKSRKKLLVAALVIAIGVLAFLKYYNFAIHSINSILGAEKLPGLQLIAPLGISYYTFMLVSYLVDVYNGKVRVEKNPARFFAYILYFPQISQGPIARYNEVAPQIFASHSYDFDTVRKGLLLMVWGFFKKLVIANRLSSYSINIANPGNGVVGAALLLGPLMFSVQVYCDFSGCMDIVRGLSECLGINLSENFERPYFSETLPEFWRRWHISLGAFFREYVFYPVSTTKLFLKLNTKSRKLFGSEAGRVIASCLPIMCVWLLTGLWHGAATNYIAWGLYHGVLICLSTAIEKPSAIWCEKLHINRENRVWKLFRMLRTFFLCLIGRIFFITDSVSHSLYVFKSIFANLGIFSISSELLPSAKSTAVILAGCLLLLCVSIVQERRKKRGETATIRDWLLGRSLPIRWAVIVSGVIMILVLGIYGPNTNASTFVYFQF